MKPRTSPENFYRKPPREMNTDFYDTSPLIRKGSTWKSKEHAGTYKITKVERVTGLVLYARLKNINQGSEFDVSPFELLNYYEPEDK